MIYLKYSFLMIADILLMPYFLIGPVFLSIFTREGSYYDDKDIIYTWGGWLGTWDNPPQGDQGYNENRAFFKGGHTTGWKGYLNRIGWLWRNPGYNFQRKIGVDFPAGRRWSLDWIGNENISDKREIPGYYFAKLKVDGRVIAFEFYLVKPWWFGKCLRIRLGHKMMTDKFKRYGFATFVDTISPLKNYGDSIKRG